MFYLVKIFFILFVFFLYLFFKVEFEVYPHLPGLSDHTLIDKPTQLPRQVVLIIVDSLRNDYIPRFDFVKKYMTKYPNSTFIAKSQVGNPTMTTQRIESMMTGSQIFSSGNILKTFLASKVDADSIIAQLNRKNKTSAILGDNTWVKLFEFTEQEVCVNTFDVHDLETCDRVVYNNLFRFLNRKDNPEKTDFIVAHLLGIDHVGHSTSSITNPMMEVKIKEFSRFLAESFERSDPKTLFLVTGDHGMRKDGNHGGTSTEQKQTFLFGFYKDGTLFRDKPSSVIAHSDITTTLSILLGIPLPNNAIGYPILNLLPSQISSKQDIVKINKNLFYHFSTMLQYYSSPLTIDQITKYSVRLSEKNSIDDQEIVIEYVAQKLNFLKYSAPNPTTLFTISMIVSILPISILFYVFAPQLYRTFTQCKPHHFLTLFCEGFPMFTLLISYFSWAIIQNLSDALLLGTLIAFVFGILLSPSVNNKVGVMAVVLGSFALLSQIQPDKSNDYKPSLIRIQSLNQIVTHWTFRALLSITEILLFLRQEVKNFNQKENKLQKNYNFLAYTRIMIALLSFGNYVFTHLLQDPVYTICILQAIIIIIYALGIRLGGIESQETSQVRVIQFLVVNFLSVFMGLHFPLILAVCLVIQMNIWSCYNYAVIMGLLSKCVWWWLGNRYEYSGVDILKTYVYSQSYAIALNAFSLIVYLNSPFILNFTLLNCRITIPRIQAGFKKIQSGQSLDSNNQQYNARQEFNSSMPYTHEFVKYLQRNNMKFTSVLLLGMVASIWTTLYNNQKILFTVVCVPILVLLTLITFTTLMLVIIASLHYQSKIKQSYESLGANSRQ